MRSALTVVGLVIALIVSVGVRSANATTIQYTFTVDHCGGGCGTSPYGTVTLTDVAAGQVSVQVDLFNGNEFVKTGFDGSFAFNLIGNPTISFVSGPTAGWTLKSTSAGTLNNFDGFKTFEYALVCCFGGSGSGSAQAGPLTFTISGSGLSTASFAELSSGSGGTGAYFVADILGGTTGNTGLVGATGPGNVVPEPGSLVLLGLGLSGLALTLRKRFSTRT